MLSNLRLFIEVFNPQGFDITIIPTDYNEPVVYRGILDKKWLRVQPGFLRSLYGAAVSSKWTMVGKVTYLPTQRDVEDTEVDERAEEIATSDEDSGEGHVIEMYARSGLDEIETEEAAMVAEGIQRNVIDEENLSMRDPFRSMFEATQVFDQMFLESQERIEILVAPLAIYHEVTISGSELETQES